MEQGEPFHGVLCEVRSRAGRSLLLSLTGVPVLDPDGALAGYRGSAVDVTERERIQRELRRSEEGMRALARALYQAGDAVVITAADDTVQYVNPAFQRMTGFSAEEALGRSSRELYGMSLSEQGHREMCLSMKQGRVWAGRMVCRRRDGTTYTEETTISPVLSEGGTVEHFVAISATCPAKSRWRLSCGRFSAWSQ